MISFRQSPYLDDDVAPRVDPRLLNIKARNSVAVYEARLNVGPLSTGGRGEPPAVAQSKADPYEVQAARALGYRFGEFGNDRRAKQRTASAHLADGGPHELFETHMDRHRIAGKSEERGRSD